MKLIFPHIDVRAGEVQLFPTVLGAIVAAMYGSELPPVIVCTLPTDKEHKSNIHRFKLYLNRRRKEVQDGNH